MSLKSSILRKKKTKNKKHKNKNKNQNKHASNFAVQHTETLQSKTASRRKQEENEEKRTQKKKKKKKKKSQTKKSLSRQANDAIVSRDSWSAVVSLCVEACTEGGSNQKKNSVGKVPNRNDEVSVVVRQNHLCSSEKIGKKLGADVQSGVEFGPRLSGAAD
jgi:hypothetical protein